MSTTIQIIPERLATVTHLDKGSHFDTKAGMCVLEAVAYVTGEPWSDRPACACPVIARYAMNLNDRMPDKQRQRLLPYIVRIAGSRATPEIEQQRAYTAATWACKVFAPLALDARGLDEHAATLRALPDITDRETALGARDAYAAAYATDTASAYAAYAAAAYAYAATVSAYAADAAAYAATAAAYAAADAAYGAVWDRSIELLDALLAIA